MNDLPIEKERAEELFQELKNRYHEALMAKDELKQAKQRLREEIAMKKGYYKKDGVTLDLAKVNARALEGAIGVFYGEKDKIGELNDEKDRFLVELQQGEISKEMADSIRYKAEQAKESASGFTDAVAELKSTEDPDVVVVIAELAKEAAKTEDMEDKGKPKKEKDLSLFQKIRDLIFS